MKVILRHLKRKHNALWVSLVWMEPFGYSTWCVWVSPLYPKKQYELSRSTFLWSALWKALWQRVP